MSKIFGNKNGSEKRAIRVLHVFAPNFKNRFGGPIFNWRYYFSRWKDTDVVHCVLDYQKNQLIESKDAFSFEYSTNQEITSRSKRALWIFPLFINLMKYKEEYDILHVHVLWWGSLLLGPWAKRNCIPALYESVLLDSDTPGGILKEKYGRFKLRLLKTYTAILAISEYLAEDYRKFGFTKQQVLTLMNCVDMELFSPLKSIEEKKILRQELDLPPDATILVFVGSVIERKGVDVLIRAFIEASSSYPDLYLLIVGPKNKNENPSMDDGFINDLYSLINKNNLAERVYFTGLIQDRRKLSELYRLADIFVFPSRNEGLPNVVLEAMASGLPVVVSHLPGLEKTIIHGENGLFVPIGDVTALSDSILMLSRDLSLAGKIGTNARGYVEKNHDFRSWQAQLVEIYSGLLS
jgi:glycosyltransferase involved in cell wall biosynthesis